MFDASFGELVLLFVIGLLVLGPQRLPKVAAELGKWVARARRTATQLRRQLEQEMELDEHKPPPRPRPPPAQPAAPPAASDDAPGASNGSGQAPQDAAAEPLETHNPHVLAEQADAERPGNGTEQSPPDR